MIPMVPEVLMKIGVVTQSTNLYGAKSDKAKSLKPSLTRVSHIFKRLMRASLNK